MKCKFQVLPRQYGKTTKLIEMFKGIVNEDKETAAFITAREVHAREVRSRLNLSPRSLNPCSVSAFINKQTVFGVKPKVYDKVLIDEYLFMTEEDQAQLYGILKSTPSIVRIMTSAAKLINKDILDIVRMNRKHEDIVAQVAFYDPEHLKHASYLAQNFLSDPNTEIIAPYPYHDYRRMMTLEQHELSMGKLYDFQEKSS